MLGAVLFAATCTAAQAQSGTKTCRQLEAQLAAVPSGSGGQQAQRFDAAIARQLEQMSKARGQAQQAGCGRAIMGRAVAQCASLNATIERMDRNLADLQQKRRAMGSGNARRDRARILASINANGCREARPPQPVASNQPPAGQVVTNGGGMRSGGLSGNFRTLCVRTCDGYYFPISYSVGPASFGRDAQACAAMCPGTQVELHHHRSPGEESEDMVSAVTGIPYRQMTNAFAYRQPNGAQPGCGCGASASSPTQRGFDVIGGDYSSDNAREREPQMPEPAPAAAPSTASARADPPAPRPETGNRAVRVVGPTFLPAPEAAADPRAPAQPLAP
ncbi:DUF2865 domain-containing protein [Mesorhizobium sp. CAU 1732]|uniref:DUF2865 domain-containing protein n=1 Tax=Mesorhizobium sp. CAU 1732 TaxID=3140358 RepID=UPI0032605701